MFGPGPHAEPGGSGNLRRNIRDSTNHVKRMACCQALHFWHGGFHQLSTRHVIPILTVGVTIRISTSNGIEDNSKDAHLSAVEHVESGGGDACRGMLG